MRKNLNSKEAHALLTVEVLELSLDHNVEGPEEQLVEVRVYGVLRLILFELLEVLSTLA